MVEAIELLRTNGLDTTNELLTDIAQLAPIEIFLSVIRWYHGRFIICHISIYRVTQKNGNF